MKTFDVGVIGIGAMGSMTAWHLAKRGLSVLGFEQFGLGHDRGASAGESRLIRTAYKRGPQYVNLLKLAHPLWTELQDEAGVNFFKLCGNVTIGKPDAADVSGILTSAESEKIDIEVLSYQEATDRCPAWRVREGEIAVLDHKAGLIRPEVAVVSAAKQAEMHGATILRETEVLSIDPHSSGVWIRTSRGDFHVQKVIVTAGAWASRFVPSGKVWPQRISLYWFLAKDASIYQVDRFPPVLRTLNGHTMNVFGTFDGCMVKAGIGASNPVEDPGDIWTVPRPEMARLQGILAEYYPDIHPEPVRVSCYVDGFAENRTPFITVSRNGNVLTAAGFSGHGFKFAPVFGQALADIATQGKTALPVESFIASD